MRHFKVEVTPEAKTDLKRYVYYVRSRLKNTQAARNILEDFRDTKARLSCCAEMLALPESEILRLRQLKRMNFLKHDYFLLYRIKEIVWK